MQSRRYKKDRQVGEQQGKQTNLKGTWKKDSKTKRQAKSNKPSKQTTGMLTSEKENRQAKSKKANK